MNSGPVSTILGHLGRAIWANLKHDQNGSARA
jgi:hypothetical protein